MGSRAAAKDAVKAVPVSVRVTQNAVRICERTLKHQVSLLRKLMGVEDYAVVRGTWRAVGWMRQRHYAHEPAYTAAVSARSTRQEAEKGLQGLGDGCA